VGLVIAKLVPIRVDPPGPYLLERQFCKRPTLPILVRSEKVFLKYKWFGHTY